MTTDLIDECDKETLFLTYFMRMVSVFFVGASIYGNYNIQGGNSLCSIVILICVILGIAAIQLCFEKQIIQDEIEHQEFLNRMDEMKQKNGGELSIKQAVHLLQNLPSL